MPIDEVKGEDSWEAAEMKYVSPICDEPQAGDCSCKGESTCPPAPQACCQPQAEAKPYAYGSSPWITGDVASNAGPIPRVATRLVFADRLGAWRVRWNIRRMDYRVPPGLYAVGALGLIRPYLSPPTTS